MKDLEIIRDSVRCYLVKNGKVVCIKTKMGKEGFFDIPVPSSFFRFLELYFL